MYGAVVIGAGPAGSAAAVTLAGAGGRVLLVEGKALPRGKSCSGILIKSTVELVGEVFGGGVPRDALCRPADNRGMVLYDEQGREHRFAQPGLNIWRSAFDMWLAGRAVQAGAELRDGTRAVSVARQDGGLAVTLEDGGRRRVERAGAVVVCDGGAGALRQALGGGAPGHIHTYQTFHHGSVDLDQHQFHAFLQRRLSGYDAWCNVKDGMVVVGVAAPEPESLAGYHVRFTHYLCREHGLRPGKQAMQERWVMPAVKPGCPLFYGEGRVLFAGEAAGLLNPMGEGISAAIASGREAALALLDQPGGAAEAYRDRIAGLHGYMVRQWRIAAKLSPSFSAMG